MLPIVNENDTVVTDEIGIGDNDTLAAIVAVHAQADLLVLLSDIDGLYTADPHKHPEAKLISMVPELTPEIWKLAEGKGSELATGGMTTKLGAAQVATSHGCDMIITNGKNPSVLYDILDGRPVGTHFLGKEKSLMTTMEMLRAAKAVVPVLAQAGEEQKNQALLAMADALLAHQGEILKANEQDLVAARGHISEVMLDRLALSESRISDMARRDSPGGGPVGSGREECCGGSNDPTVL